MSRTAALNPPPNPPPSPTPQPARPARLKRALGLGAAAAVVVGCGLAARQLPGTVGDAAGGALYAVLVYVLLGIGVMALGVMARRRDRVSPVRLGAAALVLCTLVELFQLTGWPARLAEVWAPLHLVFGSTFNAWDLAAYAVGAAAAAAVDAVLSRAAR